MAGAEPSYSPHYQSGCLLGLERSTTVVVMRLTHFPFRSTRLSHQFACGGIFKQPNTHDWRASAATICCDALYQLCEWTLCMSSETQLLEWHLHYASAVGKFQFVNNVCVCVCHSEGDMDVFTRAPTFLYIGTTHPNDYQIKRLRHFSISLFCCCSIRFFFSATHQNGSMTKCVPHQIEPHPNGNQKQWSTSIRSFQMEYYIHYIWPGNTTPCQTECLEIKITTWCVTSQHVCSIWCNEMRKIASIIGSLITSVDDECCKRRIV